jgi:cell wall assembly regulator SMI1
LTSFEPAFSRFTLRAPADATVVETFEQKSRVCLPPEYRSFVLRHNGGDGFVGKNYLILLAVEDLYEFNEGFEASRFLPWLFLFGTNGGGEAYGFDLRGVSHSVVAVPMDSMEEEYAVVVGRSFSDFLQTLLTTDDIVPRRARENE